jgi:hypothetical protein
VLIPIERIADGLSVSQRDLALSDSQIIEQYPDDPRGESCLAVGFTREGIPVQVYIPTMPKWRDPYTRNK